MPVINHLSNKQYDAFSWWFNPQTKDHDYIVMDGSIRAGKTLISSIAFVGWAMTTFNHVKFAICGQSISSIRQNIIDNLEQYYEGLNYTIIDNRSENLVTIKYGDHSNQFNLYGGEKGGSERKIAGLTLAGCFIDECTRLDERFFNMIISRCTYDKSKVWMNCNPKTPYNHVFKDWIKPLKQKNGYRVHFLLEDNPALSAHKIAQYKSWYSGVFYKRNILGKWSTAEGMVYQNFDADKTSLTHSQYHKKIAGRTMSYYVGVDFGYEHSNAIMVMADDDHGNSYLIHEYSGKHQQIEHWIKVCHNIQQRYGHSIPFYCDAARPGYIAKMNDEGINAINAFKDIQRGIELVNGLINKGRFYFIKDNTKLFLPQIFNYVFDPKSGNPVKTQNGESVDDAMDAWRYAVATKAFYASHANDSLSRDEQTQLLVDYGAITDWND